MKKIISCIILTASFTVGISLHVYAKCPDSISTHGIYKNYSFGLSIRIPRGHAGLWNSVPCVEQADGSCVCMSDHGRSIKLNDSDSIEVFAGHAAEEDESLGELMRRQWEYLKSDADGGEFVILDLHETLLGHHKAFSYQAEYDQKETTRIREGVTSQSKSKSKHFMIELDTKKESWNNNRKVLEKIIKSWKESKNSEY